MKNRDIVEKKSKVGSSQKLSLNFNVEVNILVIQKSLQYDRILNTWNVQIKKNYLGIFRQATIEAIFSIKATKDSILRCEKVRFCVTC